ncbi:AraC family transcriptional regulator [Paenibacillus endoradicis]|uniref:AraC family transcriptional regulator n=1 Tax=Paenibacillus endoradicis TaxID=2972487 RepID=UPI0021598AD8|nr:AraC family transcriptional regulator [Paenibacillus endoradicis]MCR8660222.1 AraC family transcriptional regulator [Paenibacillus endoradicis]
METAFKEWSPSIHYAQMQTMPYGKLPRRRLYDYELLYVSHGEAATEMNGQRYVLQEGQLIFLSAGIYHQNEITSRPNSQFIGIHFDFFDELDIQTEEDMVVNEDKVQSNKFCIEAVASSFSPLSEDPVYTPPLACVQLMEQLVYEFTNRSLGYELVCKALMLQILAHLLRTQITRQLADKSIHTIAIKKLMDAIQADPSASWNNKALAEIMCLNEDHMAKLFKKVARMTPGEYVSSIRHHHARRLLRETHLSIEAIGGNIGYDDPHYFSRIFRKHEGISPKQYRKLSSIL